MTGQAFSVFPEFLRQGLRFAGTVLALALMAGFLRLAPGWWPLVASFCWGLAIVTAFAGWGTLARVVLFPDRQTDIGLRIAWGFGIVLAVGGLLCSMAAAKEPALRAIVVIGVMLLALLSPRNLPGSRHDPTNRSRSRRVYSLRAVLLVTGLFVVFQYAGTLLNQNFQAPDDQAAYFGFANQILQSGTLLESFSFRRIGGYGGQSLLHAMVLVVSPLYHLHVLDRGICFVAIVLLLAGRVTVSNLPNALLILLLTLWLGQLPGVPFLNTTSIYSGILGFLGLYLTVVWVQDQKVSPLSGGLVIALCAAAVCTLRQNYLLPCILFLAGNYALRLLRCRERTEVAREMSWTALWVALLLLPWQMLALRAIGTPLYPLIKGNVSPHGFSGNAKTLADFTGMLLESAGSEPVRYALLIFLGAVFSRITKKNICLLSLLMASILSWLALCFILGRAASSDISRYSAGFMMAAVLSVILSVSRESAWASGLRKSLIPGLLIASMVFLVLKYGLVHGVRDLYREALALRVPEPRHESEPLREAVSPQTQRLVMDVLTRRSERLISALDESGPGTLARKFSDSRYKSLQQAIPPQSRLLVMVDEPYHLDFARNRIFSLDQVGYASPRLGMDRVTSDREAVAFFVGQEFRYLALVRPEQGGALLSLNTWEQVAAGIQQPWQARACETAAWQEGGRVVLPWIRRIARIGDACKSVYDDGRLLAVDLYDCRF